jgi:hypothetical protein
MILRGSCHCGNLSLVLETALAPAELPLRACQCSFCRMHGVRSISDPAGSLRFQVADPALLSRYRFGLATADFLVCARCGAYAGALMADGAQAFGIANANLFAERFADAPQPVSYDGESPEERIARRRLRWTPAALE